MTKRDNTMKRFKERKQLKSYGDATILAQEYKNAPKYKKYIIEDNVKYQMVRVGNREFKLKVAGKESLNEYIADSKLTTKQFYKKYPK
jgi:nicotinamide mononucleotide adenylyltransferase